LQRGVSHSPVSPFAFLCHPEAGVSCPTKDLGEPREASRLLRRNIRAFGSLPCKS
jgi:hypothetical protein